MFLMQPVASLVLMSMGFQNLHILISTCLNSGIQTSSHCKTEEGCPSLSLCVHHVILNYSNWSSYDNHDSLLCEGYRWPSSSSLV